MKTYMIGLIICLVGVCLALWVRKNLTVPVSVGMTDGKLHSCFQASNCVCSCDTDPKTAIAPLPVVSEHVLESIKEFLIKHYNAQVFTETPLYLHVVVSTPFFHFKDDLEFFVEKQGKRVSVRSGARVGYSDFGKNRERIEALRQYLEEKN